MINGKTKVCGVIGSPIEHTMSPMMHNFYADELGVNLAYLPFLVPSGMVEDAIKGAFALNVQGLNVTVPHKQTVMEHLIEVDPAAQVIGAVNTLVRMEAGYKGYNTDADGLLRAMKEAEIAIQGQTCILLGAGGAAKAAAYILAREGAQRVYLLNRSVAKAEELAEHIKTATGYQQIKVLPLQDWELMEEESCLAIQTTSVGMHPHTEDTIISDPRFYQKLHTAVDIIYTPAETAFMKHAAAAGAKTMNGLAMLLYQGIAAFELWNPSVQVTPQMARRAKQILMDYLKG